MSECPFSEHTLAARAKRGLDFETSTVFCARCGVGNAFHITWTGRNEARVDITIFPADGEQTISRDVVGWAVASGEDTIGDMERDGVVVTRGDTSIVQRAVEREFMPLSEAHLNAVLSRLALHVPETSDLVRIERIVSEVVEMGRLDGVLPPERLEAWIDDLREHAKDSDEDITSWLMLLWTLRAMQRRVLHVTEDKRRLRSWGEAWTALAQQMASGWDEGWSTSIADESLQEAYDVYGRLLAVQFEEELRGKHADVASSTTVGSMRRLLHKRADYQTKLGRPDLAQALMNIATLASSAESILRRSP